ncbi:MAG: hypothetical protein IPO88_11210 [Nannocystis sp.]|uniref:hypothetical protein n=1 Tax=Nannocystis sp. TaxID=1962667 RepID=UPI002422B63A|nr:hypothetical protein [Nannocystis sp.]MBK9754056.1 hypothetical protein [Nannocystis sp.]
MIDSLTRTCWVLLAISCAVHGEVVAPADDQVLAPAPDEVPPNEVVAPVRERYGMCVAYTAGRGANAAFDRGEALFQRAGADSQAARDEAAARGYLAAAAAFHAALVEDPTLGVARTNMRIAYANAALAWLNLERHPEARAALTQAAADDPAIQAHWQRAIDDLPRVPTCGFSLEAAAATSPKAAPPPESERPASTPVAPEPCAARERGKEQRKHEFIGLTVAELEASGGELLCGRASLWSLRFGTLCGDRSSFHTVVTVEVHAGRIRRVWQRENYNDAFCGPPDF